ncbi:branched-chain amino acid ABC transporter ATP-binding protein LivF [Mycolicibacterium mageritense DSM 44476 = CIP 104973]|uniref:ABC transporter ATP-binding protein n=1 Tax=Mycolicibacterium mageritense TaxID=53462 RepID=A0ABM7HP82_MYCME|nr:ABC transporter ATP-binding protein [Mycolicibacterium mageritense]MCC9184478.1 ABC transporter ATP-binding protein [Mycolicibacterium mageritense]BBX32340.1 ABC transporter ATP-binding protein [Mycolicibacterium mageritense]CDO23118.1 branched chain amino acid transport ATP-binding protein [Mycolicibacterium mageritense DSM 44476 = CIP 104973]
MSLLDVENLTSGYGRNNIIRGVTLSAEHGSITAIIGPNGAGKTTLVQTIAGVVDARGGSATLDGQNLEGMSARARARRGLGYTPQLRNVFGALSVEDNLEVVTRAMRLPRERLDEAFDTFPILAERRKQRAGTLSGGQRQQLAIASSLLMRPQLLILDEPTTGLAPQIVDSLIDQICRIERGGTGVLWVIEEHPSQILPLCKSVFLMDSGQIRHEASGPELLADPNFAEIFLGARIPTA